MKLKKILSFFKLKKEKNEEKDLEIIFESHVETDKISFSQIFVNTPIHDSENYIIDQNTEDCVSFSEDENWEEEPTTFHLFKGSLNICDIDKFRECGRCNLKQYHVSVESIFVPTSEYKDYIIRYSCCGMKQFDFEGMSYTKLDINPMWIDSHEIDIHETLASKYDFTEEPAGHDVYIFQLCYCTNLVAGAWKYFRVIKK